MPDFQRHTAALPGTLMTLLFRAGFLIVLHCLTGKVSFSACVLISVWSFQCLFAGSIYFKATIPMVIENLVHRCNPHYWYQQQSAWVQCSIPQIVLVKPLSSVGGKTKFLYTLYIWRAAQSFFHHCLFQQLDDEVSSLQCCLVLMRKREKG